MIEQLYSILSEFKKPDFMIEQKIYDKICNFNRKQFKDKKIPTDSKYFYEETAFAFMETNTECNLQGWEDLHYTPEFFYKNKNGNLVSNPDIKNITSEMVNYWEKRASEVDNPILQCRYAGLIWDFSQKIRNLKPNISNAHRFIDSIIKISELGEDSLFKNKLERGLKLAVSINDQQRITLVRNVIIKYENTYSEDNKPGTWGYSYDLLIANKDLYHKVKLEKKQEDQIIKELERKLKVFSSKNLNTSNPHSVEYIVTKLAPYYRDKNDTKNMKRVLLIYKDSFLYGIDNHCIMMGSHWLEKVRKILFQYGLSKEAKKLETKIKKLQKEDLKMLKKHELSIRIPPAGIDNYIPNLDKKTLSEALNYIAWEFIPNKEDAKDTVIEMKNKHPLSFMFSEYIMDHKGRKVTQIESDDLEGHVVQHIAQSMSFYSALIKLGLNHLEKNKSLNATTLSEHLFKSPVFPKENHPIIKEGLIAYFNKNYIASSSILMPQIESAIRELVSIAGGEIYQSSSNSKEKGFELRPLGTLLRDEIFIKTFEKLNNNIPFFFRIVLIDNRGLNLRNDICHGYFPANYFNQRITNYIIQILLILSILRKKNSS